VFNKAKGFANGPSPTAGGSPSALSSAATIVKPAFMQTTITGSIWNAWAKPPENTASQSMPMS